MINGLSQAQRTIPAGPGLGRHGDCSNLQRNNVFSFPAQGGGQGTSRHPNYDGVNVFGDEASVNVAAFGTAGAFRGNARHIRHKQV